MRDGNALAARPGARTARAGLIPRTCESEAGGVNHPVPRRRSNGWMERAVRVFAREARRGDRSPRRRPEDTRSPRPLATVHAIPDVVAAPRTRAGNRGTRLPSLVVDPGRFPAARGKSRPDCRQGRGDRVSSGRRRGLRSPRLASRAKTRTGPLHPSIRSPTGNGMITPPLGLTSPRDHPALGPSGLLAGRPERFHPAIFCPVGNRSATTLQIPLFLTSWCRPAQRVEPPLASRTPQPRGG